MSHNPLWRRSPDAACGGDGDLEKADKEGYARVKVLARFGDRQGEEGGLGLS